MITVMTTTLDKFIKEKKNLFDIIEELVTEESIHFGRLVWSISLFLCLFRLGSWFTGTTNEHI